MSDNAVSRYVLKLFFILIPSNTSVVINFNCLDEGINRKSHTGVIDVVNQLPR